VFEPVTPCLDAERYPSRPIRGTEQGLLSLRGEGDGAGLQVVDGADYLHFAFFDARGEDRLQTFQACDSIFDILDDGVSQRVAGLAFALGDGGLDEFDQSVNGAGERIFSVDVLDGSFDGPAIGVAENEDERDVEFGDGVLRAALDGNPCAVDHVASDADDEEIAHANVKQDFGRDAGIGAGNDNGFGILSFSERAEIRRAATGVDDLPLHEALITGEKFAQGFVWGEELGLWFSGGGLLSCKRKMRISETETGSAGEEVAARGLGESVHRYDLQRRTLYTRAVDAGQRYVTAYGRIPPA
jgi:hypothetical protein